MTVRLTAKEKDMICRKALKAQMSLTDYIVASSQQTPIHVAEDVRPLILELKRIGTNLNQIAAKINAGAVSAVGLQETAAELHRIYEEISRIARRD